MADSNRQQDQEVIGLLPAAGQATRISPLPVSKELYPIGFRSLPDGSLRPKVVCHYLLEKMQLAGISKAFVLLRPGKWDIPAYLGDGTMLDMHLGYLVVQLLHGVPYTLDQAYPFVKNAVIAIGFPDILFQPEDAYKRLLTRLRASTANVVIGAVPFEQSYKGGMVNFNSEGQVSQVVEKPLHSNLQYSWCTAVWTPVFTEFLHQYLRAVADERSCSDAGNQQAQPQEIPIGNVIQAAIDSGMQVEAEVLADGAYLDIGTPEDLVRAVRHFAAQEV